MFAQTFCHIKKQDFTNPASVNYCDAQSNTSIGAQYNAMNGGRQEAKRKEMLAQTGGRAAAPMGRAWPLWFRGYGRIEVLWGQTGEMGLESSFEKVLCKQ